MSSEKFSRERKSLSDILKKGIAISGAAARAVIGLGASVLLFLAFKKKKSRKR